MHARSTTFQGRPESVDAGIAYVRDEVMPTLLALEGCIGVSMMVDRTTGRCIATSAWQSEEAMRATEAAVKPLRARGAEILGASPTIEEWEIALLHRDHRSREGACVRATWFKGDPARADENIELFKNLSLPAAEQLSGFCSASLFVNRATGRGVASFTYDSKAALDRTRADADKIRAEGTRQAGSEIVEVAEFELVLAHLRVPELV